jgi:hypothetical protein
MHRRHGLRHAPDRHHSPTYKPLSLKQKPFGCLLAYIFGSRKHRNKNQLHKNLFITHNNKKMYKKSKSSA